MWSVWSKNLYVHWGLRCTLVQLQGEKIQVLEHPATWPMERVLSHIAQTLTTAKLLGTRIHVSLGAAFCPVVSYEIPAGIGNSADLRTIAMATLLRNRSAQLPDLQPGDGERAAGKMPNPNVDAPLCEMDASSPGVAASIPTGMYNSFEQWALQHRAHLASVQPLWALASRCGVVQQPGIKGLVVHEPDALTLIAQKVDGKFAANTVVQDLDEAQVALHVRRWLVSLAMGEVSIVSLRFSKPLPKPVLTPHAPRRWVGCWSQA